MRKLNDRGRADGHRGEPCRSRSGAARAQENYPSQPVRIIIPFPAGSTTDTLTRIVADQLGRKWGKAAVVENVPGMNIGAERVARADPDGYMLLASPPSPLTINKLLYHDLPYDPDKLCRSPCWRPGRTCSTSARTFPSTRWRS